MSFVDELWKAEEYLARDPDCDLGSLLSSALQWTAEETTEVAALQLTRGNWNASRITTILRRFRDHPSAPINEPTTIRLAYQNRVPEGKAGSWADVSELGLAPDELSLKYEDEFGSLGEVIDGRYRLESRIARGALAVVYRAVSLDHGEIVAIKLPVDVELVSVASKYFQLEAETTSRIERPGVPKILAFEPAPLPRLVVEYVDGVPLAEWQRTAPPDLENTRLITLSVLDVLATAHDAGIIHRDLSPNNILVDRNGVVWVTDWNTSLAENEVVSRDGDYSGTPGYASQEGLFGLTNRIDPRSDLWSVGVLLYELLSGQRLAAVANREEAVVHSAIFDPEQLPFPDGVPEWMRAVCRKALHPNPALRFGTAEEFAVALQHERVGTPTIRWIDVFELGSHFGSVRRCWLLFRQQLRLAEQTDDRSKRIHAFQLGVGQMILADQTLLQLSELARAVGLVLPTEPLPDWVFTTIYQPKEITPDWLERLQSLVTTSDTSQTALRTAAEAQMASDEMRAIFRLGYLLPCMTADRLRGELLSSHLLGAIPQGVREELVRIWDETVAGTPDSATALTLFPRRIRDWILAHDKRG